MAVRYLSEYSTGDRPAVAGAPATLLRPAGRRRESGGEALLSLAFTLIRMFDRNHR